MKKSLYFITTALMVFLFSFAVQASNLSRGSGRETDNTLVPMIQLSPASRVSESKSLKDSKADHKVAKEVSENLFSSKTLLEFVAESDFAANLEDNSAADQIGSLLLTEGIGKKRTKLFAGTRKLIGKANKEDEIQVVLFRIEETKAGKEATTLQEETYTIGASRLFHSELQFGHVGVNYLLIHVASENKAEYKLYQVIVEDTKTKDKLERMTLQFLR